jgi:hypothetical protein
MIGYKLVRKHKDGSYGPLFTNARLRIPVGVWLEAEDHPTKGFAHRPGWHVCARPEAAHLRTTGDRVWMKVEIREVTAHKRPASQGGVWYLANRIKFLEEVSYDQD